MKRVQKTGESGKYGGGRKRNRREKEEHEEGEGAERRGGLTTTVAAPKSPAKGSTIPLSCPYLSYDNTVITSLKDDNQSHQKLFQVPIPAALRGRLTAKPSGKF